MDEVSIARHLKIRAVFSDISGVLVMTRSDRRYGNLGSPRLTRRFFL